MKTFYGSFALVLAVTGCVTSDLDSTDPEAGDESAAVAGQPDGDLSGTPAGATTPNCTKWGKGRAYGVQLSSLVSVPATPDTNVHNPDKVINQSVGPVSEAAFAVASEQLLSSSSATGRAVAQANGVSVNVNGISVSAGTLFSRAESTSTIAGTSRTTAGSYVQNLIINGQTYANVRDHLVVPVTANGIKIGEVRVLEPNASGIDGLVIRVFDLTATPVNEATTLTISHAEASSNFPNCPS